MLVIDQLSCVSFIKPVTNYFSNSLHMGLKLYQHKFKGEKQTHTLTFISQTSYLVIQL